MKPLTAPVIHSCGHETAYAFDDRARVEDILRFRADRSEEPCRACAREPRYKAGMDMSDGTGGGSFVTITDNDGNTTRLDKPRPDERKTQADHIANLYLKHFPPPPQKAPPQ